MVAYCKVAFLLRIAESKGGGDLSREDMLILEVVFSSSSEDGSWLGLL